MSRTKKNIYPEGTEAIITKTSKHHHFKLGEKVTYLVSKVGKKGVMTHQFANHSEIYNLAEGEFEIYNNPLIEKLRKVAEDFFTENRSIPLDETIRIREIDLGKGKEILVIASGGKINQETYAANSEGNYLAEEILDEVKEVELVGFDCEYEVNLRFKERKKLT